MKICVYGNYALADVELIAVAMPVAEIKNFGPSFKLWVGW